MLLILLLPSRRHLANDSGPQIVAQSPPGCITATENTLRAPLIDFDVLQEYIIPRQAFCNRQVTVNSPDGRYVILGYPVVIPHPKYLRNEFIFNFGLLLEADAAVDLIPYERVVRRLATTFAEMEMQNEYLSQREKSAKRRESDDTTGTGTDVPPSAVSPAEEEETMGTRRPIESLLEIVKEDLNNYGECMIPVGKNPKMFDVKNRGAFC